ncbi:MAG: hypothetical protein LBL41_00445 [Bifidobacteriaceae bacterium]|nr:hypothetical protein [Bifidobacteriaceae bacterium]
MTNKKVFHALRTRSRVNFTARAVATRKLADAKGVRLAGVHFSQDFFLT